MSFAGFGIVATVHPDPREIDRCLGELVEMGFTHVELPIEKWGIFAGGKVATRQLARFAAVTNRWRDRLRYTAHGPFAFWLLAHNQTDLRRQMLRAGMEATRSFGAELMVYDTI